MTTARSQAALAGIGTRFVALAVDGIILGIIMGILFGTAEGPGGILGIVVGLAYHWYFLTQRKGQTPGKMLMNIRVVKVDGSPISHTDAAIRYAGYTINSAVLMLGWIWALFDENKQGWHDKLASTVVVPA